MDFPSYFRCPISMELMEDPVTLVTGVTYERKNIEKWFFTYKNKTCPATMQIIEDLMIVPNHTLNRLILSWKMEESCLSTHRQPLIKPEEMAATVNAVESSPFKVSALKKLKSCLELGDHIKADFIKSYNGVELIVKIVVQILTETSDHSATFEACEQGLSILSKLPLSTKEKTFELLTKPEAMKSMAIVIQRGSAESRFHTITVLKKLAESSSDFNWNFFIEDQGMDFFKSLLELVSDELCTESSSYTLEVMIQIMSNTKKSQLRAIETGTIHTLIELIPESNCSKCEKMLHIIKLLCEFAEGRVCLVEHGMGIAVVTKTIFNVSTFATSCGVEILWLLCSNFEPRNRVWEEMFVCGSVEKLLVLLGMELGRCSMKEKVVKIFKYLHGSSWRNHPCFPSEPNGRHYCEF